MGLRQHLLTISASALVLTGCVGAIDRADFDTEVQRRGGGLTSSFVDASLEQVATEVGASSAADLDIITLTIQPPRRVVIAQVRRADRPDFVDVVTTRDSEVVAVSPVQDADDLPLDEVTIPVGSLPLDDIESLGDGALAAFDDDEAFVARIRVSLIAGTHVVDVDIESPRRTATYRSSLDGTDLEEL